MEKELHSSINDENQTISQEKLFPSGVLLVKNFHLFFIIVLFLLFFIYYMVDAQSLNSQRLIKLISGLLISGTIYFGIHKVKSWVVVLILFQSYMGGAFTLVNYLDFQANTGTGIAFKFIYILVMFFHGYQIIIFSKSETRKFFRESGTTII